MVPFLSLCARDVMSPDPVTVDPSLTLAELRRRFEETHFGSFPVVANDVLVGMVSEFDLLEACLLRPTSMIPHFDEILAMPVSAVMTKNCVSVAPDEPLSHVLEKMVPRRLKAVPVVDGDRVVGIIARTDLLVGLHERVKESGDKA
ncbi:CBS domain-containing protein [Lentisalinibacter orientalis]|jgi:CBS domain-containing protein|uniref:CBS domain-containing protein n=1 Tax=Lentisalinibacter orientalis TaxID=2992241 RepID=UPI00386CA4F4